MESAQKNHIEHVPLFEDCLLKLEAGEEKYQAPLTAFNGRDADLDAYQDLIDAVNYQAQGIMEATYDDQTEESEMQERIETFFFTVEIALLVRNRLVKKGILE